MSEWTSDELTKVATAEELKITSMRRDGTLRKPVTIWVVRVGACLYVRSIKGRTGPWFRGTQSRREGHIRAGGVDKDVSFLDADEDASEEIDAAYRAKYDRYPASVLNTVLTPAARSATIQLVPRTADDARS
jgi:hypothetical protein